MKNFKPLKRRITSYLLVMSPVFILFSLLGTLLLALQIYQTTTNFLPTRALGISLVIYNSTYSREAGLLTGYSLNQVNALPTLLIAFLTLSLLIGIGLLLENKFIKRKTL